MTTLITLVMTMIFIATLAVITALRWPNTVTWVHVAVAVLAPVAAETIHLLIH